MKESTKLSVFTSISLFLAELVMPFCVIYYSDVLHVSIGTLGILYAAQTGVAVVLSIPMNWIGDKLFRKPFMLLGSLVNAGCFYMLTKIQTVQELAIVLLVFGVAQAFSSVGGGFMAELTEGQKRGTKLGVFMFFTGIAGAAAMLVGAKAIEAFGFQYLFYIAAGAAVFDGFTTIIISPKKEKMSEAPMEWNSGQSD